MKSILTSFAMPHPKLLSFRLRRRKGLDYDFGGCKSLSIEEVRGDRLYSEGPSPTYPGTRDYIISEGASLSLLRRCGETAYIVKDQVRRIRVHVTIFSHSP